MTDPRDAAFLSPDAPEVFHSVEHRHEMWKDDPYDVETLHAEARDAFARLLTRATTPPGLPSGRMLLILGESGSGKTHLLRAFRARAHEIGDGYVGYMQMTTATLSYPRYILANLIDSLEKPYFELNDPQLSGLARLAQGLASRCMDGATLARLQDDELTGEELTRTVNDAADRLLGRAGYDTLDLDLLRALLLFNRRDPRVRNRLLKHLRCEDYTPEDRTLIAGLPPRLHDDDPFRVLEGLGRLVWVLSQKSLILFADQLEDMYDPQDVAQAKARFLRAMTTLSAVADRVPSSIIVICCLEDLYHALQGSLTRSLVDRLERDPEPLRLSSERSLDEVRALVSRRVGHLYDTMGVAHAADDTYPFDDAFLARLTRQRTRDVLEQCRLQRSERLGGGRAGRAAPATAPPPPTLPLQQLWNDFRSGYQTPRPTDDAAIAELLTWALNACGDELESGLRFAARAQGSTIDVVVTRHGPPVEQLFVKLCNKGSQAGALAKQLGELRLLAGARVPVAVRSTEFPTGPKTQAAMELGKLVAARGRRVVLEDSTLLTIMALRDFRAAHERDPGFAAWLGQENPLSQLHTMRRMLDLDILDAPAPAAAAAPDATPAPPEPPAPRPAAPAPGPAIVLGRTDGLESRDLTLDVEELRKHAAFLGMPGSGKTTLVLSVVDDLLARGVPVILVDRKGDLAGHVRDAGFAAAHGIDARLYTPGSTAGRPLSVRLVPEGLHTLPAGDRDEEAELAAQAIAAMLDLKSTVRDKGQRVVLTQAVKQLAAQPEPVTLDRLVRHIGDEDPSLLAAVGRLDPKSFGLLAENLEILKHSLARLLAPGAEPLDIDALLGRGAHAVPGKTRLAIISTKFLGDESAVLFWVAQLLLLLGRWSSRNPSPDRLQAAILFDEADLYLPALRVPPTKQPMESLLKRARSAGVSVLLATQSPGDLDYKARDNIATWFVGRITTTVALGKIKPLLVESRVDISSKLPSRKAGQFYMFRGGDAVPFTGRLPAIMPVQLAEHEILELARR